MNHTYYISELSSIISNLERLKRGMEQERDREKGSQERESDYALAPSNIAYDRERFDEAPRPVRPESRPVQNGEELVLCHCGLKAEFKKSAPQNPKQWQAYFCARPKNDPKNCGFRKWID